MSRAGEDLLGQLRIERGTEPPAAASAWLRWLPWVLLLLLLAAAGWWSMDRGAAPPQLRTGVVQAAASAARSASVLDASGYVVARRQATVSSKVTGKVLEVSIEEGMRVEQGQVLARLEDSQQQADFALRQAQVSAARAQLAEIEAQLRQARADRLRQEELQARQLGTRAALDAAIAQADALAARLASQRRQVEVAERSLAMVQVALDDTVIRAPFAGIVVAKAAQPGEMISPVSAGGGFTRTGIGTIVDMDSLEVEVDVNEAFIGRVGADMATEATLNAYPDWKIPGRVIAVIPAADRTKATVRVRVALDSRDARIVPDMGVRVRFLDARGEQPSAGSAAPGLLLPAAALSQRDGQDVVFVLDGERASLRRVQPGPRQGDLLQLPGGLPIGAVVILDPPPGLADGDRVRRAP